MSGNQNTQIATVRERQHSLVESIKHPRMQEQIKKSLPPGVPMDRFTAVTIAAFNHNPDLVAADRQSLFNAILKSAQEGLLPDGQDAVLNVYNTNVAPKGKTPKYVKKVQFQRMKMGVIKQFKKAGIDAYASCVYEGEVFDLWNDDTGQHIRHTPKPFRKDKGEMLGSYAVAPMPNGKCIVATMDLEAIQRARSKSKSGDGANAPWQMWFDQMAEKSALHRLRRRVAIIDDEAAKHLNVIDEEFEEPESTEEQPEQPIPTGNESRPKSLQSVVDMDEDQLSEYHAPDEAGDHYEDEPDGGDDSGPRKGDVI